ncbi:Winged helix-turn-helix DNA-binding domain (plasmid) [Nostoc flagelliforme CCNUN1]|uniref:Winged helix-turn-helix DNA-binding domain n=1 Tax=Nostoc flagelliforme CCNUN1 TaxID=2038116 RepID=A0A2K8T6Y5_9NOSO|nr:helix-turn-helix domain-containing protein [Nostoc flagelliforme]AUB43466.1 Winged helix-turn-helix DNA-binding domain [Nostoc flagelliforme CCNUN1]
MGFRNGKPSKQFTAIPNSLIRDHNLTDSTFRLISWVASHDENFDISFTVIEKHLGYKRDKIRNAIKNAEQNDYLVRVQENNPNNGKFDWQYYIFTSKEDTKLFRENHSSIGKSSIGESSVSGSSIGGSSIGGLSIGGSSTPHIEKQLEENKLEEKHIQEAPPTQNTFPTQESCVRETEQTELTEQPRQPELEEPTPQQPTALSKKSVESQQTDNPSRRSTIAPGSFEKSEQSNNQLVAPNPKSASPTSLPDSTCYTMHPTEKTEQAMRESGLPPWMEKTGPNGWKTEFVESYRQYLNSTPRYAKELIRQATTGEAKNALTRLSKTDSGKAEIQNHWDSFNELKERQQPTQSKHNANTSNDDVLAMAIAADEERRQQEQSKQERKNEYRFSPQMLELKAKLQAAVNTPKPQPNSRFSSVDLREVEAQLKLALKA